MKRWIICLAAALAALTVFSRAAELPGELTDALPEGTVYVTLTRHPEHDGWRSITVEGGAAR